MKIEDKLKNYLMVINSNYNELGDDLVSFTINEVIDRVKLYLNRNDIPTEVERVIAKIINNSLIKCKKEMELAKTGDIDVAISSISDNGQSISYSNEVKNYFATASDNEIFSGFEKLLSRYRMIKVVYPKNI